MAVDNSQSAFNAVSNRLAAAGYGAASDMTSHAYNTVGGAIISNANNLLTSFTATEVSMQTQCSTGDRLVFIGSIPLSSPVWRYRV